MTALLVQNSKIKKMTGVETWNFGITAIKYCPMAGICKEACYATMGRFAMPNVKNAYMYRGWMTEQKEFPEVMTELIQSKGIARIRIHDSGDFYSKKYLDKWLKIIDANPQTQFYCYTKMVRMMKEAKLPDNLTVIYSFGGKQDHLIDIENDRHSKVFTDLKELEDSGYINTTEDDAHALTDNKKIGLFYRGYKSRQNHWR